MQTNLLKYFTMNKKTFNIFCSTYGHNYFRLNHANENTPDLICKCCKTYFNYNHNGSIYSVFNKENEKLTSVLHRKKTA